ncbi:MAG: alpha/beta hydrolase [Ferrovibrio sp.]|uniref:alpha/beta fold hydrolase n=1 Tax=Ferrovibrio sp. TaxID=1917215 RepID=UPI0026295FAB|nr:alpha/beta hydrolase [Ferrovibrio sp.]MCW0232610.1 alpha/beta hydrolase [Ferrovibrio sp.]
MKQVTSGRARLATFVAGSGAPVVFLHAAVCDSRMWQGQIEAVGGTHQAIAYDRRGFGRTVAEQEDHSAVADLLAVLDVVAAGRPATLVACSQGGRVALDAALLHPECIRGLVLISPSVAGAPDPVLSPEIEALVARQKQAEAAGDLDRVNAIKAHLWLDGPLQLEGRVVGAARALFLDMNGIALRAPPAGANVDAVSAFQRLGEISVPALVICGAYDFPHIAERCRHLATAMPHTVHHALPGAAHLPSIERPAEITALIGKFLGN